MNFAMRLFAITILFCAFSTHAELLILKQTDAGFAPLDDSDKPNIPVIEDILMKYQWPTSAAFALEPVEKRFNIIKDMGDLFTPDKPNAEEIWIEQKIQQETSNNTYRVVFFPTVLYELFAIIHAYQTKNEKNPLQNAIDQIFAPKIRGDIIDKAKINLSTIINGAQSNQQIRHEIGSL